MFLTLESIIINPEILCNLTLIHVMPNTVSRLKQLLKQFPIFPKPLLEVIWSVGTYMWVDGGMEDFVENYVFLARNGWKTVQTWIHSDALADINKISKMTKNGHFRQKMVIFDKKRHFWPPKTPRSAQKVQSPKKSQPWHQRVTKMQAFDAYIKVCNPRVPASQPSTRVKNCHYLPFLMIFLISAYFKTNFRPKLGRFG